MNHHAKFVLTKKSSTPNSAVSEVKIHQAKDDFNQLKKLVTLITAERIREGLLDRITTYTADHPELSDIIGNGWPVVMQHCKKFPHLTEFVVGTFKEKLFSSNVLSGPYSAYGLSTEIVKAAGIIWQEEDSHHSIYNTIKNKAQVFSRTSLMSCLSSLNLAFSLMITGKITKSHRTNSHRCFIANWRRMCQPANNKLGSRSTFFY